MVPFFLGGGGVGTLQMAGLSKKKKKLKAWTYIPRMQRERENVWLMDVGVDRKKS